MERVEVPVRQQRQKKERMRSRRTVECSQPAEPPLGCPPQASLLNLMTGNMQRYMNNMGVNEQVLLRIGPGNCLTDRRLIRTLALVKQNLETFTQRPFLFLSEVDDPAHLYIVGP